MAKYVVTGTYVQVRTMTREGPRIVGLNRDAPVPPDASADWIQGHLGCGLIAEVGESAEAPAESESKGGEDLTPQQKAARTRAANAAKGSE